MFYENNPLGKAKKPLKICLLRSHSVETMVPFLKTYLRADGFEPEVHLGGYNQFQQEIIDYDSFIYQDSWDIIYLSIRLEELSLKLTDDFLSLNKNNIVDEIKYIKENVINLISILRKKIDTPIILNNYIIPCKGKYGIYESNYLFGQKEIIWRLNTEILEDVSGLFKSVYFLDINGLSSKVGHVNFFDNRMFYIAKVPYSANGLIEISRELCLVIKIISSSRKKCIVLDCDNTLWGGIIGEDGFDGIKLSEEYPGVCYKNFQKHLLDYSRKGFILAINSKNNYDDVISVLDNHPHQILKKNNFAIIKAGWDQKNIYYDEIINTLNIGFDSSIFIDDNPVECKLIKDSFPDVQVINFPKDPLEIENIITNIDGLEILSLTKEDKEKTKQYIDNAKRNKLFKSSQNITDFYFSLEMSMRILKNNKSYIDRNTQLTQKTNQFNLTTKRYTESNILNYYNSKEAIIYNFSLQDKFGDNGIVGLAIILLENKISIIDTLLMSCRVISRTAENNFLKYILDDLSCLGYKTIIGKWEKSNRNVIVENFYDSFGFDIVEESKTNKKYQFNISNYKAQYDKWIKMEVV